MREHNNALSYLRLTLLLVALSTYDANGNIVSVTDANGNVVANSYDALNWLVSTTQDPGGLAIEVESGYDQGGNKVLVVDGKGQETRFVYDGLGRNTALIYGFATGDEDVTTYVFNALNKIERIDPNGITTRYAYDARHRLEQVTYFDGATPVNTATNSTRTYSYDTAGNILSVVEPGKADGSADVAYRYDHLDRVVREVSQGIAHGYGYDAAGNRIEAVCDVGGAHPLTIASTYDAHNRLLTMTEAPGSGQRVTTYGYDLAGNVVRKALPNGQFQNSRYDELGRQTYKTQNYDEFTTLMSWSTRYDLAGNARIILEDHLIDDGLPGRRITNTYDAVNRLVKEVTETGPVDQFGGTSVYDTQTTTDYAYDDAHNRILRVKGGVATHYGFNAVNQLVWAGPQADGSVKGIEYSYDANGNRTVRAESAGANDIYTWDFENRLVDLQKQSVDGAGAYDFGYDYRTRRVWLNPPGLTQPTKVVFSGGTSAREYEGGSAAPTVEYIRGSDWGGGVGGIIYTLRSSQPSYNFYNTRGDVVVKTNDSRTMTYGAQYEAFGLRTQEFGSTLDRQKSNTKDEDIPGYANEGFRFRDLDTGAFLSRDPLGFVDGPNVYAYVVQNPWTKFDPLGLYDVT